MFPYPSEEQEDPLAGIEQSLAPPQPALLPSRMDEALDYRVRLNVEAREKLGRELTEAYNAFRAQMDDRLSNARLWREDVEMLPWSGPQPWSGASQVRAPLTATAVRSHSQRLNNMLCQANPPFRAKADAKETVQWLRPIEDVLTSKLKEAKWEDAARELHEGLPIDAAALLGVFYKKEMGRKPVPQMRMDEGLAEELVGAGMDFAEAMAASAATDAKGQAKLSVGFEEFVKYDGPEFRFAPMERMVILPATAERLEDIWAMGERLTVRGSELKRGAKKGKYIKAAVKELITRGSDAKTTDEDDDYEYASGVDQDIPEWFGGKDEFKEFQLVELYLLHDLDEDGEEEWYCVTFHPDSSLVLRVQYSPYEDGECPWVPFGYIKRHGRFWSQSIAERNATMQSSASCALNAAHNLTDILAGSGSSFFYPPTAFAQGANPASWEWVPGKPWPCNQPQQLVFAQFPQLPAAIAAQIQIYAMAKANSELLCSTSDLTLGKETEGDKTAREASIVANAAHQGFLDYAVNVALGWSDVMKRFVSRIAQYAENGQVSYQVQAGAEAQEGREVWDIGEGGEPVQGMVPAGETGFGKVPAEVLQLPVSLAPAGIFGYADAETRFRASALLLETLSANPLTAQMPEVLLEAMDQFITDSRTPNADQLTEKLYAGWAELQQAMQMQAAMQQQAMQQEQQVQGQQAQREGQQLSMQEQEQGRKAGLEEQQAGMAAEKHVMEMAGMVPAPKPGAQQTGAKKK